MSSKVKRFQSNSKGEDYVVGDLHGCFEDLLLMLKAMNFNEKVDRVFSVGDLIDRGPDSYECARLIYKPWFHAVQGNHEDLMIQSILHSTQYAVGVWMSNGGQWIYKTGTWDKQYTDEQLKKLATDLNKLPYVIVVGKDDERFNIVHAEFVRFGVGGRGNISDEDIDNWTFSSTEEYSMLWGRDLIRGPSVDVPVHKGLSHTYVGHTPLRKVVWAHQQMYLDTGCAYHYFGRSTSDDHTLSIAATKQRIIYQWNPSWKKLSQIKFVDVPDVLELINTEKNV